MSESNSNSGVGVGFAELLLLLFVGLKLGGVITWSWWWVMSPLWITVLFVVLVFLVFWWNDWL